VTRQTLILGRLFDIRVGVHVSWLAVYAFMTFALARALGMLPQAEAYAFGAICALALFASVVAHELAHALVARRFGVRTCAITLFLFGGVATLEREPATPRTDALVALAGPAMSAALAVLGLGLLFALDRALPDGALRDALGLLGTYVVLANGVLAAFNILPAYPMDGGRVLRALIWRRTGNRDAATNAASRVGIDLAYGWYVILGAFLLRQGSSQERATRTPPLTPDTEAIAAA
jgi:Zn-dependent protease